MNICLRVKCNVFGYFHFVRTFTQKLAVTKNCSMKILNVAEKNDAAKHISAFLSGGNSQRREGLSKYNKIYEFNYNFRGQNARMVMTSVSGHLLNYSFTGHYKKWHGCSPEDLFDAPVVKECPEDYVQIKNTLEREVRSCDVLIIWTDCDREGENIGFEIINVCRQIKPRIEVYRAKFSEITSQSVRNAIANLGQPNKLVSDAVDVRSELDLRIGASFTRFQTLRLKRVFPDVLGDCLISYGSCQFPTLGFVVERYKAVQDFIVETFWKIKVTHKIDDKTVEFAWKRVKLFDELVCRVLYERCLERRTATVQKVETKPKSKWRPTALDTVELEKVGSRKLKINAKETMRIAERLYSQGFISYPRTETNIFPQGIDLGNLVALHRGDNRWGQFAEKVLQAGVNPRNGKKSDQAHPPIHPTKYTDKLGGDEGKVYEYIVRHFLACVSKDAEGLETTVEIDINDEKFTAHGLQILALNYLEVFPYEKWNPKEIHAYQQGQRFEPTTIEMVEGQTSPPNLLTEADLINLMEKNGIGTDATHAEHIDTIKQRMYVGLLDEIYFIPGELGIGLVEGYDSMGFEMSKPHLRAELENDLKRICEGTKDPKVALREQVNKYREVFKKAVEQANKIDQSLSKYLKSQPNVIENNINAVMNLPQHVLKCSSCGSGMVLRERANNTPFLSCLGFSSSCRNAIWFPSKVLDVQLAPDACTHCGPDVRMLTFKFRSGTMMPYYTDVYTGCIGGCDEDFISMLEIRRDSGSSSNTNSLSTSTVVSSASSSNYHHFGASNSTNAAPSRPVASNSNYNRYGGTDSTNAAPNGPTTNWPSTSENRQSRMTPFGDTENAEVQCNCGLPARKFTVQKDTPNKGRQFYSCSKSPGDTARCQFFLWADANAPPGNFNSQPNYNQQNSNQGQYTNYRNRNNSAAPTFRARKRSATSRTTTTRKCGNCRQEGHNRNNCPLLRM